MYLTPSVWTSEAAGRFAQFAQFAHREKSAFEGREREWFAKATAHVLRLANTLTYVEWALTTDFGKPVTINKATIEAAIGLVRNYFWPHARACLRLIGLTERHTNARRALLWIRAKERIESIEGGDPSRCPIATAGRRRDDSLAGGPM